MFISKREQNAGEESTCLLEMAELFPSVCLSVLCAGNCFSPHVRVYILTAFRRRNVRATFSENTVKSLVVNDY